MKDALQPRGQAHDLALKAAETDATKRALATFGNTFGLALYDLNWTGGVKRVKRDADTKRTWTIRSQNGKANTTFAKPCDFATALQKALSEASDVEALLRLWERNVDEVRTVNRAYQEKDMPESKIASELVDHLKQCAVAIAAPRPEQPKERSNGDARSEAPAQEPQTIDKSVLAIAEPKRIRSKEHLKFVARQPCVICGRKPSHAHHLRHAQVTRLELEGQRRVHRAALRNTSQRRPPGGQRGNLVAGPRPRSSANRSKSVGAASRKMRG